MSECPNVRFLGLGHLFIYQSCIGYENYVGVKEINITFSLLYRRKKVFFFFIESLASFKRGLCGTLLHVTLAYTNVVFIVENANNTQNICLPL